MHALCHTRDLLLCATQPPAANASGMALPAQEGASTSTSCHIAQPCLTTLNGDMPQVQCPRVASVQQTDTGMVLAKQERAVPHSLLGPPSAVQVDWHAVNLHVQHVQQKMSVVKVCTYQAAKYLSDRPVVLRIWCATFCCN